MSKPTTDNRASDSATEDHLASTSLKVKMNLFPLNVQLDAVFSYDVAISPAIVNNHTKQKVLETFLAEKKLSPFLFQQDQIIIPIRFETMEGQVSFGGSTYSITLRLSEKKLFKTDEQTQNETMNGVFEKMGMNQIGRNYFWQHKTVDLENNANLEIRQGLTSAIHIGKGVPPNKGKTAINPKLSQSPEKMAPNSTQGTFMEVDLVSKVAHKNTVFQEIQQLLNAHKSQAEIEEAMVGRNFFTKHNQKVYRIDGIAWNIHPSTTFQWTVKSGTQGPTQETSAGQDQRTQETTYAQYFKQKYNVDLRQNNQPFLICSMNRGPRRGNVSPENNAIYIPTELAILINLSDSEREDYRLMKEVTQTTQYKPNDRQTQLTDFVKDARLIRELNQWQVKVGQEMVSTDAKQFEPVKVQVASRTLTGPNWQYDLNRNKVLEPIKLVNWVLIHEKGRIYPDRIASLITDFQTYGIAIGMSISKPKIYGVDNIESFLNTYKGMEQGQLVQIILTIGTGRAKKLYRAIKQRCYEELGIPSQHMRLKSIEKHPESVLRNILRQMNVKAFTDPKTGDFSSGTLWSIANSCIPDNSMVVGMDVWHGFSGESESIAGIVSSFDGGMRFYADPLLLNRVSQEIVPNLGEVIKKRLVQYFEEYDCYPENVIIFRDGVGNSQMAQLIQQEFTHLFEGLKLLKEDTPKVAVVCANKRIHRRIFVPGISGTVDNAPVGTVVDGIGNAEDFPNFYMVSHSTNQGTITPTHYSVIFNNTDLTTEQLIEIAYQLAHLYYNWPGGIRTPSPIEYAHKLAFQMGQAGLSEIHPRLEKTHYYL
jgi:aubergine-like protein